MSAPLRPGRIGFVGLGFVVVIVLVMTAVSLCQEVHRTLCDCPCEQNGRARPP